MEPAADEYEKIVQAILQQEVDGLSLGKEVVVKRDTKIRGLSGFEHQIDVSFACQILGVELLFIVECKCYKRKVTVGDILTFKGRIDDIRAHKGIFVTTKGYQKGAYQVARENRIALVLVKSTTYIPMQASSPLGVELARIYLWRLLEDYTHHHGELSHEIETGSYRRQEAIIPDKEVFQFEDLGFRFFFRRGNQEVSFRAGELSPGIGTMRCEYEPGDTIAFTVDEGMTIPTKCLLKYLVSRELCADNPTRS